MLEKLSELVDAEGLERRNLCGVCTDGAPAMFGARSGFMTLVKRKAPGACSLHCMIHRQALTSKTLPQVLKETLDTVIRTVNFVKTSALNSRLFKKLCHDMDYVHEMLLFYTQIPWLSKGNVV